MMKTDIVMGREIYGDEEIFITRAGATVRIEDDCCRSTFLFAKGYNTKANECQLRE